jgi:hypothetical protein
MLRCAVVQPVIGCFLAFLAANSSSPPQCCSSLQDVCCALAKNFNILLVFEVYLMVVTGLLSDQDYCL